MAVPGTRRLRRWWHTPRVRGRVVVALLALVAFGGALLAGAWFRACANEACPSIAGLTNYDPEQASRVFAADGRLITDLGLQRRTVVPLSQMSRAVVAAFLVTEDKRFYSHHGIDFWRVAGAVKANLLSGRVAQGFSTITMQLAGNLWPEDINRRERSLTRKIREARVALEIERNYPKDKILELYLNQINLGNRAFGVEAAAQRYFGRSARDLNVAEAAMLAALPKAPERYNPRRNPRRAIQRRNLVIGLMRDAGLLTPAEAERWRAFPLQLSTRSDYTGVADYFVEYVRQQLDARFGSDLYRSGLRIYTTLDLDMQQAAERALAAQLDAIEAGRFGKYRHQTYRQYLDARGDAPDAGRTTTPYLQGLVVTIEAKTGAIRALVGGRDFEDSKFNRATQALRQAGSTFKPFVYSAAVRAGVPLSRVMEDAPISLEIPDQPLWEPQNYDMKFLGPMSLRKALYQSRNTIAIRLGMEVGLEQVVEEATRFGLTGKRIPQVPSVSIGAADVIPLEMVAAFVPFATLGLKTTVTAIQRVEDRTGNILWQPRVRSERVMEPGHAWIMADALQDVVRRGTARSAVIGEGFTLPAGGKTGTTNDGFDVWFIGFTPELVSGVWIGLDQPAKIKDNAQGGVLAAPAWSAMMRDIYDRRPAPAGWARPDDLVGLDIDVATGCPAGPATPADRRQTEWFLPGTAFGEACGGFRIPPAVTPEAVPAEGIADH